MKTFYIYSLSDPRTYRPKYIGCTQDLSKRYSGHVGFFYTKGRINAKLSTWFNELKLLNLTPELVVIEEINGLNMALKREGEYISLLLYFGIELCNIMSSGKNNKSIKLNNGE